MRAWSPRPSTPPGGIDLLDERFDEARALFHQAAALATDPDLLGRIEQNLATVAGTQGDYPEALERYQRSLAGFLARRQRAGLRRRLPQPRRHQHRPPAMGRRRSLPPPLPPDGAPHGRPPPPRPGRHESRRGVDRPRIACARPGWPPRRRRASSTSCTRRSSWPTPTGCWAPCSADWASFPPPRRASASPSRWHRRPATP